MVTTKNNKNKNNNHNHNHNNNMERSTPNSAIRTNILTPGSTSPDPVPVSLPGDEATSNSKSQSEKADLFLPFKFLSSRTTSITKEWVKKNRH